MTFLWKDLTSQEAEQFEHWTFLFKGQSTVYNQENVFPKNDRPAVYI